MNLVLDIGGTKTRIGLVSDTHKLLETSFFLTDKIYDTGIKNILDFIRGKDIRIANICVGIAGVIDGGKLYSSPNMKGWIGKPIKADFEKEFVAEVIIENDAALAGLGEAVYGAGKDYKIVSYFTISTGVGGARIVNKNIDERVYGFEPGHQYISLKSSPSETAKKKSNKIVIASSAKQSLSRHSRDLPAVLEGGGNLYKKDDSQTRTFESLVSGKSIKRIYGEIPENITDKNVWEKIVKKTAIGISNAIYFWSPEIIVLGGGVASSEYFDIALLKKEIKKIIKRTYPTTPEIKKSALGDFSGIWGGIAYLENNF